jgi:hypothetical protein
MPLKPQRGGMAIPEKGVLGTMPPRWGLRREINGTSSYKHAIPDGIVQVTLAAGIR